MTLGDDEISIKKYFAKVIELSNSGEEFPIDLDDVWPLVYSRRDKAINTLVNNEQFVEDVDYKPLPLSVERKDGKGGQNRVNYRISLSCFEFLIAKKVRPVFEVYRRMFHKTVGGLIREASLEEYTKAKRVALEFVFETLNVNEVSKINLLNANFSYLGLSLPSYAKTDDATMSASDAIKHYGYESVINVKKLNIILQEQGYIEKLTRKSTSSKSGVAEFWNVTSKGLEFGENAVSPKSPNETRPRWFVNKFPDLMKRLGLI